jgi:outer membrane immunogenic protein
MFGGVFGHDWTRGQLLFGFVTDYQWSSVQGSVTDQYGFGASRTLTSKLKDFGTARGRIGVTYGRWLGYATGGLAYGSVSVSDCYRDPFFSSCMTNESFSRGFAYGAGIEAFVFDNVTAKLEYLKISLPVTHTTSSPYPYDRKTKFDTDFWRFGINYRF